MPEPSVSATAETTAAEDLCPTCLKPRELCVCAEAVPVENRVHLLVLQHPQEQDKALATARLAVHALAHATFRIGLSWPSLGKALGRAAEPRRWGVVHLGAIRPADFPAGREVAAFDKKGKAVADQDAALAEIEGVVLLDGSWSQAKTLWWRNPWVLKTKRIALRPRHPSLYGRLRREPRREGLSTIEAAALVLARLEGRPEIETELTRLFRRMLDRYRESQARVPATDAGTAAAGG
jgi:DTW domain-containing protein YfiP